MLTIHVEVDRREAILQGIAAQGSHTVELSQQWLSQLPSELRELLSKYGADPSLNRNILLVVEPSEEGVRVALEQKLADIARKEEEKARADAERIEALRKLVPSLLTLSAEEVIGSYNHGHRLLQCREAFPDDQGLQALIEAVQNEQARRKAFDDAQAKAEKELREARRDAWGLLIRRIVQDNVLELEQSVCLEMQERFAAGLLPSDEVKAHLRRHVFEPFFGKTPYKPLKASDVPHKSSCDGSLVEYDALVLTECDAGTFQTLKDLEAIAQIARERMEALLSPDLFDMETEPQVHTAVCASCSAKAERDSFFVSLRISEERMSKQYLL